MSALRGTPNGLEPQAVVCLTWWHVAPLSGEKWHTKGPLKCSVKG